LGALARLRKSGDADVLAELMKSRARTGQRRVHYGLLTMTPRAAAPSLASSVIGELPQRADDARAHCFADRAVTREAMSTSVTAHLGESHA
jgi:hypothetical protein